ncbi:Hypothetical_protein [Hexamita inflata]|uniref:Hypothetical_protein n=1 Tax=Hexamita inflata TaxID=28002 RepID=A0ABP1HEE6_9EUKA
MKIASSTIPSDAKFVETKTERFVLMTEATLQEQTEGSKNISMYVKNYLISDKLEIMFLQQRFPGLTAFLFPHQMNQHIKLPMLSKVHHIVSPQYSPRNGIEQPEYLADLTLINLQKYTHKKHFIQEDLQQMFNFIDLGVENSEQSDFSYL